MKALVLALIGVFAWRRMSDGRKAQLLDKVPFLKLGKKTKARAKLADLRGSLPGHA